MNVHTFSRYVKYGQSFFISKIISKSYCRGDRMVSFRKIRWK